jgi:hypothetical protein
MKPETKINKELKGGPTACKKRGSPAEYSRKTPEFALQPIRIITGCTGNINFSYT